MSQPFKSGWFVVELMGHRRYVGHVTEVRMGGAELFRLESPRDPEPIEVLFGAASIYAMTRTTEERARQEHRREEENERRHLLSAPPFGRVCNQVDEGQAADDLGDADDFIPEAPGDYDDGRTP